MPIRVGIDLVAADSVEQSLRAPHGERYLQRVYTEREVEDCRTGAGVDPERLAARFAAKEATLKVLPVGNEGLALTEIEVCREPSGRVHIELSGRAAELATDAGVAELSASLTHEAGFAAAVVVAEFREARAAGPRSAQRLARLQRRVNDNATDMYDQIRQIIAAHGRMPVDAHGLDDHADLYQAGMTSHASVNVMLALEDAFDIEFPDAMLTRRVFESIASIAAALMELEATAA